MTHLPLIAPRHPLIPWLLLGLALAVLGAALGADRWLAWQAVDAHERQHLLDTAKGIEKHLANRLQTTSNLLEAQRADLPWLLAQADGLSRLNRRLATLVASTEGLRTLLVVDVQGIAFASNRAELIGKSFRDQERYRTMSRNANPDTLYVSAPWRQETLIRLGLFALITLVAVVGLIAYQRRQRADARWQAAAEAARAKAQEALL